MCHQDGEAPMVRTQMEETPSVKERASSIKDRASSVKERASSISFYLDGEDSCEEGGGSSHLPKGRVD